MGVGGQRMRAGGTRRQPPFGTSCSVGGHLCTPAAAALLYLDGDTLRVVMANQHQHLPVGTRWGGGGGGCAGGYAVTARHGTGKVGKKDCGPVDAKARSRDLRNEAPARTSPPEQEERESVCVCGGGGGSSQGLAACLRERGAAPPLPSLACREASIERVMNS